MKVGKLLLPLIAILGFALGIYFTSFSTVNTVSNVVNSENGIKYHSLVCVYKNGELIDCNPNLFTNAGRNLIRDYLNNASATQLNWVQYIAVGNGTGTQDVGDTTLNLEIATCGLTRAIGSKYQNATAGVWFVEKVFTVSSCGGTIRVNTTGLFNQTSSGALFAENTFTNADLQNNDQLNVTWTLAVT